MTGVYEMLARALGKELATATGLIYFLGIIFLAVLECLGACEELFHIFPSTKVTLTLTLTRTRTLTPTPILTLALTLALTQTLTRRAPSASPSWATSGTRWARPRRGSSSRWR